MAQYRMVDQETLIASIGREIQGDNLLGIEREKAIREFMTYASEFNLDGCPELRHKAEHTLRVTEDAEEIARRAVAEGGLYDAAAAEAMGLPGNWVPDAGASLLLGLFHDVGRFLQYAMFRTYSDAQSYPHAEISYRMLSRFGMLRRFVDEPSSDEGEALVRRILLAVRTHSDLSVDDYHGEDRAYCDVVRDADKIDIIEICCHALSGDGFPDMVAEARERLSRGDGLPDVPPTEAPYVRDVATRWESGFSVSPEVMRDVRLGGLVDRRHIRTAGDSLMASVSLAQDIWTRPAREMLDERGVMPVLRDVICGTYAEMDETGTLERAVLSVVGDE